MKWSVVGGVATAWIVVALVWASQATLGAVLDGEPMGFGAALRAAVIQTLPWIPSTLVVVALALRFPVTEGRWRRTVWIHLAAVPAVAFLSNTGVVAGFWLLAGSWQGLPALLRGGVLWGSRRIGMTAALYLAIAGLTWGIRYRRELQRRELVLARREARVAEARLQALTAQIRPHFLFNTLHTIGQLWRSGRSDEADAMLDRLGALFHRVQASTDRPTIPLEQELEMVDDYLSIERTRFRDRLTTRSDVDPGALGVPVPPLLLQPLVENAIRHGVSRLSGPGSVVVRGRVEAGELILEVEDDGPGPAEPGEDGTGLRTTRARLDEMYGSDATLSLGPGPGGGTIVRVALPVEREAIRA